MLKTDFIEINGRKVYAPAGLPPENKIILGLPARRAVAQIVKEMQASHPESPMANKEVVSLFFKWGLYFRGTYPQGRELARLVASIAGHETEWDTTGNSPRDDLKNPFGYGPFWKFRDYNHAIYRITRALQIYYLSEGYDTISKISGKWAPVGAGNDPHNANSNWTAGVSAIYRELGGKLY